MALTVSQDTSEFIFTRICASGGINKVRLYGTVNGTADQQIDTTKTVTWSNAQAGSTTTDVVFTVPQPTTTIIVEYAVLYDSTDTELFGELDFDGSTYTYNSNGEFTLSSIDLDLA